MRFPLVLSLCLTLTAIAQERVVFEELPGVLLSNEKIQLTVLPEGGAMVRLGLVGEPRPVDPLWNPFAIAREAGQNRPANFYRGHFICVDGFGPSSPEEQAAGLPMHGEAHRLPWQLDSYGKQGGLLSAAFSVTMPLSHERLTRTYRMADGEHIVWVESGLENLLAFDRPAFWGEHATIGAPFLEPGKVVVDMPAARAKTKAHPSQGNTSNRQLQSFADFTWPLAPTRDGQTFDLRAAPMRPGSTDHTTSLIDPSRDLGFVTALHLDRRLLIGWVFRREDFPWVQTWLAYPGPGRMARGLEFATQPFDLPRADVLKSGSLFDTPVFRILPAKSKITADFLMFYTTVPEGFQKVDDIRFEGGTLVIEDRGAAKRISLAASRRL